MTNNSLIKVAETIYCGDFAIYQENNNWIAADTILDVSKTFQTFDQALEYAESEMDYVARHFH
jgi:hypothetical protein